MATKKADDIPVSACNDLLDHALACCCLSSDPVVCISMRYPGTNIPDWYGQEGEIEKCSCVCHDGRDEENYSDEV